MRISLRALDIGLAAVSAVLTLIALFGEEVAALTDASLAGSRSWVAPLMLVPSAALLFRRTSPLATIAGVWVPVAVHAQLTGDGGEGLYLVWPAWVSLYALAAYGTRRQLLTGIPLALVCLTVHDLNDPLNWRSAAEGSSISGATHHRLPARLASVRAATSSPNSAISVRTADTAARPMSSARGGMRTGGR